MSMKYIRTDKNGTKIYHDYTCPRCGGAGGADVWAYTGWNCYKCGGTGKSVNPRIVKIYTPEYQAKLDVRRAARQKKQQAETEARRLAEYDGNLKESLAKNGFNAEGKTFIFLGETFSKKDEIKEAGGKFEPAIGWHIDHKIEGFDFIEASVQEVADIDAWGHIHITATRYEWDKKKKEAQKDEPDAGFYGNVGDKVQLEVELVNTAGYDVKGPWGVQTRYIHTMKDADGHIFVWKTGAHLDKGEGDEYHPIQKGEHFNIKGTVKEHSEYRDQMQTVLTRCKVA